MPRLLLVSLAVVLTLSSTTPTNAQPADSTAITDSLQMALQQFERAESPTAADSAGLRRWADSVHATGQSLERKNPSEARGYFQDALLASESLSDLARVARYNNAIGETYRLASQFDRALDRFREALQISQELNNREEIAHSLNRIGITHMRKGRYEKALARYHKSLEIRRDLDNREDVAYTLNNIAIVHENQGRYGEALARYRESLQIKRDLGDRESIAGSLYNIGAVRFRQGQYDKALLKAQQSLKLRREIEDRVGLASSLNLIAGIHLRKSRYSKALAYYREALQINREIGDQGGVALNLTNIGFIYDEQGQHKRALARYQEGLQVYKKIGFQMGVARTLNNVAVTYKELGKREEALTRYRESLQLYREMGNRDGASAALGNIANVHREQRQFEEALSQFRESLQIKREIGDRKGIANSLRNIGRTHTDQGRYSEALARYREALNMQQEIGDQKGITESLGSIGSAHLETGRYQAATDTLGHAVLLANNLRLNATSPEARRSLLSTQIDAYRALTTAHVRSDRPDSALHSIEQARARLLADRLAGTATGDTSFALPSVAEHRQTLSSDEAALLYANANSKWPLTAIVVTQDTTVARELPDSTIRAAVENKYSTRLNRLRRAEGSLTAAMNRSASSRPGTTPSLAEIIRLYRYYLTRAQNETTAQNDLSRRLHDLLVDPIAGAIEGKGELITVPTGALGYLPFETLQDANGRYLVETTHVRYAQSLTVLRQLQKRDYDDSERPLLALGGAAYASNEPMESGSVISEARRGTTRVATRGHASTLLRDADRRMKQGKSPRPTYQQLGYARWSNLPGTQSEVQQLGEMFGDAATVISGAGASEDSVRALDEQGRLRSYRRVHFATHGMAVPEAPELSALVLSQVGASDSLAARDGFLTMDEIADLEMRADVAVLSACQTGLGKLVAGEGVVSLSHAFLRAGANASLVSQWKVLDESTRQFMTAVYKRAQTEETSFAEAVSATKRAFIAGEHGKKNTDPLRWAPFVYYGQE